MNSLLVVINVMTTKKILLIHKEPIIQEVVQACLTDFGGWNVQVADSTAEGLQKAKLERPDAMILEVSVGEIDGLQFLKEIKAQPITQEIPVVLLSLKTKWFHLQESWFKAYKLPVVKLNPLEPAILPVEIANVLDWDLDIDKLS
jgi:CheY-like chemotaxis protein